MKPQTPKGAYEVSLKIVNSNFRKTKKSASWRIIGYYEITKPHPCLAPE